MDGGDHCPMSVYSSPQTIHLKVVKMANFMLCVFYHNFKKITSFKTHEKRHDACKCGN